MDGSLLLTSIVHDDVKHICYRWRLIPVNNHGVATVEHEKPLRLFPFCQHGDKYVVFDEQCNVKLASFHSLFGTVERPVDLPHKVIKNGRIVLVGDQRVLSIYQIFKDESSIAKVSTVRLPKNARWSLIKDYYVIIGDEKTSISSPDLKGKVFINSSLLNVVTLIPNRKYLLVYKTKYNVLSTVGGLDSWTLSEDFYFSLPLKNSIVSQATNRLYLVNEDNHIFSIKTKDITRKGYNRVRLHYHLTIPFLAVDAVALDDRFLLVSTEDFGLLRVDVENVVPTFDQFLPLKSPMLDSAFMHSSSRECSAKEGFIDWPITCMRMIRPSGLSLHMAPFLITQSNAVASLVSILDIPKAECSSVKILDFDNVFDYWVSDQNTLAIRHFDLSISLYSRNHTKSPILQKSKSFFQIPINKLSLESVLTIEGNCILYRDKCVQVRDGRVETFRIPEAPASFDIIPNHGIVYCANNKLEFLSFKSNVVSFIQSGSFYTIKAFKDCNHLYVLFTDGTRLYYHTNASQHFSNSVSSIKLPGILEIDFRQPDVFCCLTSDGTFHDIILNEMDSNLYLKRQRIVGSTSFSCTCYNSSELIHFWESPTVSHGQQYIEYPGFATFSLPIECQKPFMEFDNSLLYGNSQGFFLLELPVFSPEKFRVMNISKNFFPGFLRWTFPLLHTEKGFLFGAISLSPISEFQMEATLMVLNQKLDIVYQLTYSCACSNVTVLDELSAFSNTLHGSDLEKSFIVAYSRPEEDVSLVLYTLRESSDGFFLAQQSISLPSLKYVRGISVFDNQIICSGAGTKAVILKHKGSWFLETGRSLSSDMDVRQTISLGYNSFLHLTNSGFYASKDLDWEEKLGHIDQIDEIIPLKNDLYCFASLTVGKLYIVEIEKNFKLQMIGQRDFSGPITCVYYDTFSSRIFIAIERAKVFSLGGEKFNFAHIRGIPY